MRARSGRGQALARGISGDCKTVRAAAVNADKDRCVMTHLSKKNLGPRFQAMNGAIVGQSSWLPVLRASLPAERLGGRDAARPGRRNSCPTLSASRFMAPMCVHSWRSEPPMKPRSKAGCPQLAGPRGHRALLFSDAFSRQSFSQVKHTTGARKFGEPELFVKSLRARVRCAHSKMHAGRTFSHEFLQ